jgi:hypothetical protein
VSTLDRPTVGELLADSDLLAREALLEMSADRALGMVREWPQLIKSAAELWAILPREPTVSANGDPMAILAAMGSALRHSRAAGHWPGHGPTDESCEQIGANFTQARRLLQGPPVTSGAVSMPNQTGPTAAHTQILHALYVAAHATAVALTGYERDLQRCLEVGARRRQPLLERPTALEVESARGMMARFDAIEQLTVASVGARRINAADQPATSRHRPATRLSAALAAWEIQADRTLAVARGWHSTEAAVELLIRARGGRFVDPSQPWLRTDDPGIVWLDARVIRQYAQAVSSGERHVLALVEAILLREPLEHVGGLMASLDPYHLGLVLAVLWHTGWGSGPTGIPQSFDNRELDPRKTRLASARDD